MGRTPHQPDHLDRRRRDDVERQLADALRRRGDGRSVHEFLVDSLADAVEELAEGRELIGCGQHPHA